MREHCLTHITGFLFLGYLYDKTESNFLPVLVLDCLFHAVGGVLICLIPPLQKFVQRHTSSHTKSSMHQDDVTQDIKFKVVEQA